MRAFWIALLAALLAAPCARAAEPSSPPAAPLQAPARALKIGTVDLTRVWSDYHRRNDFDKEFKSFQENLTLALRARQEEADGLDKDIQQLAMGTKERQDLEEKRKAVLKEGEELRQKSQEELNQKSVAIFRELLDDVTREVEAVGKEGNFDFILKDQTVSNNIRYPEEFVLQIGQKVVLFSKPEYDLTSLVLGRLNQKYDSAQKKAASAPGPAAAQPASPAKEK